MNKASAPMPSAVLRGAGQAMTPFTLPLSLPIEPSTDATNSVRNGSPPPPADVSATAEHAFEKGFEEGIQRGRREAASEHQKQMKMLADRVGNAHQAELAAARAASRREVLAGLGEGLDRLDGLLTAANASVIERLKSAEDDLVAICMQVCALILGNAFVEPRAVVAHVRTALNGVDAGTLLAVHLHPRDLAFLDAARAAAVRDAVPGVTWVPDHSIALGGCVIRTPSGGLDARLDTQIGLLRDRLLAARRKRHEPADHADQDGTA